MPANAASAYPEFYPDATDLCLKLGAFRLERGKTLNSASLACRLYSPPNNPRAPIFIALGGISAGRNICGDNSGRRGWWQSIVGPGKALDTRCYRVLGVDFLGIGDSTHPQHLTDWAITPADQARAIFHCLEQLGIKQVEGIIGASYGGMIALHAAALYSTRIQRTLALCCAHRNSATTSAYRALQRQIVRFAQQQGAINEGLRIARGLAMLGFRTRDELDQRFANSGTVQAQQLFLPIENYLSARGSDYTRHTSAASFHCLSQSCDLHQLNPNSVRTDLWLAGSPSDQIIPFEDLEALAKTAPKLRYFQRIESRYGHDCFLKETATISQIVSRFATGDLA